MYWLLGLLAAPFVAAFVVFTAFLVYCTAKRLKKSGIPWYIRGVIWFWIVVGWPCDVLFNQTWGRVIFGEARGTTFSDHVRWRVELESGRLRPSTKMWAFFLQDGDPVGHNYGL
jgi:hypothetical protein